LPALKAEQIDPLEEAALRIDNTMLDWQKDRGKEFDQELRERLGGPASGPSVSTQVTEEPAPRDAPPALRVESLPRLVDPPPMKVESFRIESAPTHVVNPPPLKAKAIPAELKARPVETAVPAERETSSPPQHAPKPRPKNAKGAVWAKHPQSRRGKRKGKHRRR
jgi:hypothetical protein